MITEAEVTNVESELRQNLMRGYRRVRSAQSQGVYLETGECVLELLGDPHLLVFTDHAAGLRLKIPVVFVAHWELEDRDGAPDGVRNAMRHPDAVLTGYKRLGRSRHNTDRRDASVHDVLVRALRPYVSDFPDEGILLDWLWVPRPAEDHDEIRSENWFAYRQAQRKPNSIFKDVASDLPSHVRSVDGLVRLSFPILKDKAYPVQMVTIVLGLDLQKEDLEKQHEFEERTSRIARIVRQITRVLMTEIPQLYARITEREPHTSTLVRTPDWLRHTDRDSLHVAVDDLHRKIISLSARVKLPGWLDPERGFNFLVAFRELDDDYHATLRYYLSVYNLRALGAQDDLTEWRASFEMSLDRIEGKLQSLFERSDTPGGAIRAFHEYRTKCQQEINEIFAAGNGLDETRRSLANSIEKLPYRMRLTPGYWVMDQRHPEVIEDWLSDPRARHFDDYPARLLVWEATALPERIYYSPIADGAVPIGICGVNEQLISSEKCPAYELQELIDESAPRFRGILANNELSMLAAELLDRLYKLGDEIQDGSRLWGPILRRFRRLAYYYLPDVTDYYTKLVKESDLAESFGRAGWRPGGQQLWWILDGLIPSQLSALETVNHLGSDKAPNHSDEKREQTEKTDFLGQYIRKIASLDDRIPALPNAHLHRVRLSAARDVSLLVLIPSAHHNDLAQELIDRFLSTCEAVLNQFNQYGKLSPRGKAVEPRKSYDVFLSYNSQDRDVVERFARGLRELNVTPWYDEWDMPIGQSFMSSLEHAITHISCAAVFVSSKGLGAWQDPEVEAVLNHITRTTGTLIPVLIDEINITQLRPFLQRFPVFRAYDRKDPIKDLADYIKKAKQRKSRGPHWSNDDEPSV